MHGQRPERRGQGDVQADGATRTVGGGRLQRADFVAADRRSDHHHRCRIETAAPDQIANAAVDAGADAIIVGAQPDAARRGLAHSAAVLSPVLAPCFRLGALVRVFGDEIDRTRLQLGKDLADIFADDADHDELHAADGHQADHQRGIARDRLSGGPGFPQDRKPEQERHGCERHAEQAGKPQRRYREGGQAFDRKPDQPAGAEGGDAVRAGRGFVVDADLAEADPACQSLEEAVALGQLPQRRHRARRQQAEVAGVLGDLLARAPVDQRVEAMHGEPSRKQFIVAMRLGGIDHVVAAIDPVADQLLDQVGRMLTVAVHEHDRAAPGMVQSRHQGGFLAEIARQRHHLNVERIGLERPRRSASVASVRAVIDIDDLAREAVTLPQRPGERDQTFMQSRKPGRLVKDGHDDRQPLRRGGGRGGGQAGNIFTQHHRSGSIPTNMAIAARVRHGIAASGAAPHCRRNASSLAKSGLSRSST